jgi:hypothetical protein
MPHINWDVFLYPTNLIWLLVTVGTAAYAALQRDSALRIGGGFLLLIHLAGVPQYPFIDVAVASLTTDILAWGVLMFVALRYGANWSLFAAAWVLLACTATLTYWLSDFTGMDIPQALTATFGMFWWLLASAALFAGTLSARERTQDRTADLEGLGVGTRLAH